MTPKGAPATRANAKERLTTAAPMILSYNLNGAAASQALRSPPNGAAAQGAPNNEVSGEEAGMLIGKRGAAASAISTADPLRVTVRGRDLAGDLMGSATFTEFFFFLATGRMPSAEQRFFLDLALVAIAEHGLTPSVQAARMTYAADPAALQGAIAAGVLGCGTVILGAAREADALLEQVLKRIDAGATPDEAAEAAARDHRTAKKPLAGFGHPLHKPVDPRAERMIALARERGIAGRGVDAATRLAAAAARVWEKPLPMNVSMAIAATLRDAEVPAAMIRGVPILARVAGLIAHLAEETETPIGFAMASQAEEAIRYAGPEAGAPTA
jgi:citrate synthase